MIDLTNLLSWAWEREYLTQIFQTIPQIDAVAVHWRSERLFRRRLPWLRSKYRKEKLRIPEGLDENSIFIILSDELYRIPENLPARIIFKQYVSNRDTVSIPFPLGIRNGFPQLTAKPISERKLDVAFVGRIYPHRRRFLTELSAHPRLKKFKLNLTTKGRLSISQYADLLNETKVSLCLPGNSSPETFRFYESIKLGCIPLTATMPSNGLYRRHPGFEVGDIDDVEKVAEVITSILANPREHAALQERSLATWDSCYSPTAVAGMIRSVVSSRRSGASQATSAHRSAAR